MDWQSLLIDNWHIKVVCITLIVAAWIDGKELKVPNWITFPMVGTGLIYSTVVGGWYGFLFGLLGMVVGLLCLLPLYSVGGMGAGDVKLMAGVGAWVGWKLTFYAFCVSTVVGAVMAIIMVLYKRDWKKHYANTFMIVNEWLDVRNPKKLTEIAAERKPRMLLLPYGIPICIGCIGYFQYTGLLF